MAEITSTFDEPFAFEPITGSPTLQWRGKRPFALPSFYPAQLRESYGPSTDGWRNRLYWGDNLQVMSHLLKEFRGAVQLIYIDPPFDSKADYRRRISLRGQTVTGDRNGFEEKQYTDIWINDEYLQYMYERLVLLRELLSRTGVIYVQADHRKEHHLRMLMDEVFGPENFLNKISWRSQVARGAKVNAYYLPYSTHYITIYAKRKHPASTTWHPQRRRILLTEAEAAQEFMADEKGYFRTSDPGSYSFESLCRLHERGLLYAPYGGAVVVDPDSRRVYASNGGNIAVKYYLEALGNGRFAANRALDNLWEDVPGLGTTPGEDVRYPTQKTEALLRRIIAMSSDPGDIVFDAFMGSGTAQVVAMEMGRKFLGSDINWGSIQTVTRRLWAAAQEIEGQRSAPAQGQLLDEEEENANGGAGATHYTGFEVYNVNGYDFFRNPVEAKALILEALNTQPLAAGSVFDGVLDGRMVKVMPVNRIAVRADLNDLLANIDYKGLQHRYLESPHRVVEKITLVCMGHEPDLGACLVQELHPYQVDVEVLDVLRGRQDIEFKRDAEARLAASSGLLTVEAFYPMNLLQKLSLQKEAVTDWRELVDCILIDWNYDGAIFTPSLMDAPEEGQFVAGRYPIPGDAGSIRIRIIDLLSELWEGTVTYA